MMLLFMRSHWIVVDLCKKHQLNDIIKSASKYNVILIDSLNITKDGTLTLQNQPATVPNDPNYQPYFVKDGQLNPYFANGDGTKTVRFSDMVGKLKASGIPYIGFTTEYGPDFGYNWKNIVLIMQNDSLKQTLLKNLGVLSTLGINTWDSDYEGGFNFKNQIQMVHQ